MWKPGKLGGKHRGSQPGAVVDFGEWFGDFSSRASLVMPCDHDYQTGHGADNDGVDDFEDDETNPNDANGWNYIGFVSRKLKNFDDAERYYAVGLEINPNHVGILEYQGELYIETNRLEMAEENLEKLNDLCIFNCTERNELRSLISSAYE